MDCTARQTLLLFFLLLPGIGSLHAQDQLQLLHADQLRSTQKQNKNIQQLNGDVRFRRGDYLLYCDHAIRYEATDRSVFWGNVQVYGLQDTLFSDSLTVVNDQDLLIAHGNARIRSGLQKIDARRIRFFTETDIIEAAGNVTMQDSGQYVRADSVWYEDTTGRTELYGSRQEFATILNEIDRTKIQGPIIFQNTKSGSLKATLRPILTKLDSLGETVVRITGNTITGNSDSGRFVARDRVIITRDSLRAESGLATFYEKKEFAVLKEEPVVYHTENTIRGHIIEIYFSGNTLESVYIPRDATVHSLTHGYVKNPIPQPPDTAVTPADTTGIPPPEWRPKAPTEEENILKGEQLRMWFSGNQVSRIRVMNMAQSTYHVFEDSLYQGINETSGDTIVLQFTEQGDSLRQIDVIGGTRGTFKPHASNTSVDTTIFYEAEHIVFKVPERITYLQHDAHTRYKDMRLEAAFIDVFWNRNLLVATPYVDSVEVAKGEPNIPVFSQQGKEPMSGKKLEYNLRTKRGRVVHGQTELEDGYYTGKNIMKRGENTLYVQSGVYTTCDLDWPHYYFQSSRMKLLIKDKVIARPIVMYIHDVPVFGLPFGVFPQRGGRRQSGYILPSWGENASSGRYLKGTGYYWAPSDYWDYRLLFDFWEERGMTFRQRIRYRKRYRFSGNISLTNDYQLFREGKPRNFSVVVRHNQTIDPTMTLRVNGRYVSSSRFLRETSLKRENRLRQQVISNATLSKRWEDTKNSMTVNLNRTENLLNGNINEVIPQISFRRGTDKLISAPKGANFRVKNRWYYNVNYSYGVNFRNRHDHTFNTNSFYTDIYGRRIELEEDSVFVDKYQRAVQHNLSFNSPNKIFKYFSVTPSLNINEDWVPGYRVPKIEDGIVVVDTTTNAPQYRVIERFSARHTFNFSVNTSTKLYGLFHIPFGPVKAIRHVLTPSVSYRIAPDFSKKMYGYYTYSTMPDSSILKDDRFTGSMIGSTPRSESRSMRFSLRNIFQAKYLSGQGEEAEEEKIDFLTWSINTGYNFVAKEKPWSSIRSSIRASLGRQLALDINLTHYPYKYQSSQLTFPRLTNMSVRTGFSFSGRGFTRSTARGDSAQASRVDTTVTDTTDILSPTESMEQSLFSTETSSRFGAGKGNLWKMRFSFNYSVTRNDPTIHRDPNFWMNMNTDLNLTENWSIAINSRFDLAKRALVSSDFTIKRDLHCWELSFRWTPGGFGRGYYLKINVKSPNLQDVKVESQGGRYNRYGY